MVEIPHSRSVLIVCVGFIERNLVQHTQDSMQRREPGIARLGKRYNDTCARMALLIRRRNAPRGATAPRPIPRDKMFGLDVDDEIWQDIEPDDENGESDSEHSRQPAVPRWLGDQSVRDGIPAMLVLARCQEEERRLEGELYALSEWARIEFLAIEVAKLWTGTCSVALIGLSC